MDIGGYGLIERAVKAGVLGGRSGDYAAGALALEDVGVAVAQDVVEMEPGVVEGYQVSADGDGSRRAGRADFRAPGSGGDQDGIVSIFGFCSLD